MGRHHSKAEIKEALEACQGAVYLTAEKLGMSPSGVYARIAKSPDLKEVIERLDGRLVDLAELKLQQAIREGERWAILFALRTKGKHRGYSEKLEVEQHGRLQIELEPKVGPELDQAIQRALGVLAAGSEKSAPSPGDALPRDFRAPR